MIDFLGKHLIIEKEDACWCEKNLNGENREENKRRKRQKSGNGLLMKREMIDWFLASDEKHVLLSRFFVAGQIFRNI